MTNKCDCDAPKTIMRTLDRFRTSTGRFGTVRCSYPSRFVSIEIVKVRCHNCNEIFNEMIPWDWYYDRDDNLVSYTYLWHCLNDRDAVYDKVRKIVLAKHSVRLGKYGIEVQS